MKIRLFRLFAVIAFLVGAQSAYAVTECPITIRSTYSGGGVLWVVGTNNSQFSVPIESKGPGSNYFPIELDITN
jgi:hypothetical protein